MHLILPLSAVGKNRVEKSGQLLSTSIAMGKPKYSSGICTFHYTKYTLYTLPGKYTRQACVCVLGVGLN
jgi:hypothetical protein